MVESPISKVPFNCKDSNSAYKSNVVGEKKIIFSQQEKKELQKARDLVNYVFMMASESF